MKKHVSIKDEITFMIFGWKCKWNPELVDRSHGKFDEWKVFKFERNVFWVEIENGEVSGNLILELGRVFSL